MRDIFVLKNLEYSEGACVTEGRMLTTCDWSQQSYGTEEHRIKHQSCILRKKVGTSF